MGAFCEYLTDTDMIVCRAMLAAKKSINGPPAIVLDIQWKLLLSISISFSLSILMLSVCSFYLFLERCEASWARAALLGGLGVLFCLLKDERVYDMISHLVIPPFYFGKHRIEEEEEEEGRSCGNCAIYIRATEWSDCGACWNVVRA